MTSGALAYLRSPTGACQREHGYQPCSVPEASGEAEHGEKGLCGGLFKVSRKGNGDKPLSTHRSK